MIQEMSSDTEYEAMKETVLEIVTQNFRPEFINRIDDIVVFHSLQKDQVKAITNIQVQQLSKRLQDQEIAITISPEAMEWLGNIGYDPVYGARPLKRTIQNHLETPLAKAILSGKFHPGSSITIQLGENRLHFTET